MNDRHLDVIDRATMDNVSNENELIYTFEDGEEMTGEIEHDKLMELVKEHGFVKVKKVGSI